MKSKSVRSSTRSNILRATTARRRNCYGIGRTTLYRKLKEYRLEEIPEAKPMDSAGFDNIRRLSKDSRSSRRQ